MNKIFETGKEQSQLIEGLQNQLDKFVLLKRLQDGTLYTFYEIKQNKNHQSKNLTA